MANKRPVPFLKNPLEKKEEKVGKDLDNDGEKGEPLAHKKKVLGPAAAGAAAVKGKGKGAKAALKEIPSGGLKKSGKMPFPGKKK